ncbi:hypothetical protein [Parendozoicomonas haliclonae]|uniref:Uncharacterized protein n=1 Tax=Parendozoicomonas haliclonae TaxID=1960125 RepID=A0A1X7AP62_9GAMM|nr:hypothetical protein [Parendozoicomonas haliclonae]SMA50045.1 hypothetical protein EHSB41UT_03836 [Parendozoicomonas haliclonae]
MTPSGKAEQSSQSQQAQLWDNRIPDNLLHQELPESPAIPVKSSLIIRDDGEALTLTNPPLSRIGVSLLLLAFIIFSVTACYVVYGIQSMISYMLLIPLVFSSMVLVLLFIALTFGTRSSTATRHQLNTSFKVFGLTLHRQTLRTSEILSLEIHRGYGMNSKKYFQLLALPRTGKNLVLIAADIPSQQQAETLKGNVEKQLA